VYRTKREAQTSWNRIVKPALLTCFQQIIERQATSQVSVKVLSKGSATFPKVAAREAAYRLVVAFAVKSGTASVTVKARFDIVLLGRGRADVALFMLGLREPLTAGFEQSLVRAAAGRLKP
jgi:hypothetical protein